MTVIEKIEDQQKGHENTLAWCVGQTLKEICEADPDCARIVAEDLENESMSIHECAKKNQENADRIQKQTRGICVYVPQSEEERIIREFYGLPAAAPKVKPEQEQPKAAALDLFSFF